MTRAILLLCAAGIVLASRSPAADPAPPESAETWTAVPLPDGTVMYVRYGAPGGVRIGRSPAPAAVPDTAAAAAVRPPGGDPAAGGGVDLVRQVLREELALRNRGARIPARPEAVAPAAAAGPQGPDVVILDRRGAPLAADTTGARTAPPARTPGAEARDDDRPEPPLPLPPPPVVDTRIVREQFMSGGLFRTNLILFETDRAEILPFSAEVLRVVGRVLEEFPRVRVSIEGHTDHRGSEAHNLDLSRRRAAAVCAHLLEATSLAADQLEPKGFGESSPIAAGDSPTALALNRRVEFRILNPDVLERRIEEPPAR